MKKIKRVLLVLLLLSTVILSGCKNKEINYDDFTSYMKKKGFEITDAAEQFKDYPNIKKSYVASNGNYQIEYYELSDLEYAKSFYKSNKTIFKEFITDSKNISTDSSNNDIEKFRATDNGYYMSLTRINKTVLFAKISDEYKDEISKLIKNLGY